MINSPFPSLLWNTIIDLYPEDIATIQQGFSQTRIGSFRVNTLHPKVQLFYDEFRSKNIPIIAGFQEGVFLFDPKNLFAIKGTSAFYDGIIYLQSISSLLPVMMMNLSQNASVLDVCAAPGSKTSQMAAMMQNNGNIMALEKNKIRYDKLVHNLKIQHVTNVQAIKTDAIDWLEKNPSSFFSHILLDAPCSSEGRMSFDQEKTFGFWNAETNAKNALLQSQLLSSALDHLLPGGELLYSTCTISPAENEGVLSTVLASRTDVFLVPFAENSVRIPEMRAGKTSFRGLSYLPDCVHALRVIPSPQTEGFFMAKIVKK